MTVLVLNCGSSTVKFQVIDGAERRRARGRIERIGSDAAAITLAAEGRADVRTIEPIGDHEAAVRRVVDWITGTAPAGSAGAGAGVDAVGHRVVHGGARFVEPVLIDAAVIAGIEELEDLAPLHNRPSLAGIRAARAVLGGAVPMVAVFDTAFHAALPERARRYAIPWDLAERYGIRRFGFHGTSYRYVTERYARLAGVPPGRGRIVALHLGNGASAAAIRDGASIDTSMGFTPLEGLVMGTRAGDLDASIVGYLARKEGVAAADVERWLNERSGLLGVSGRSADMRDLLEREATDARARLAVELFCYRARKYVGAYLAALGGADALVFTGGIGERAPAVRARICAGLEWCGLVLDPARNAAAVDGDARIGADRARVQAYVIPTDEELLIARDTIACLGRAAGVTDARG
jgi:acetate kinase